MATTKLFSLRQKNLPWLAVLFMFSASSRRLVATNILWTSVRAWTHQTFSGGTNLCFPNACRYSRYCRRHQLSGDAAHVRGRCNHDRNGHRSLSILMTAIDQEMNTSKTIESTWNILGLKREVSRQVLRTHKKVGKANERLRKAQETVERLTKDDTATLKELEECPDVETLELELSELQTRLQGLNQLEDYLQSVKKNSSVLSEEMVSLALDLGVNDEPQPRPDRGPRKKKGPREQAKSRLPYRRYYSFNNIEIRVGKQAEDNDQLSLSPKHRDGSDWWMHASGCPGSHVVIRYGNNELPEEVVQDAACLAARQSKCQGNVIKVSLTRCRDVKKPPGAKPGLVQLTGRVQTVSVDMNKAQERLERLEKTVLVN